jgi:hypothetical protein
MKSHREDGYILASAIAVLLAISLVAAALVSASVDSLRRIQRFEKEIAGDEALRSALLVVASQLSLDPRRRQMALENGAGSIDLLGHRVGVQVSWENAKLDVNLADRKDVEAALIDASADEYLRKAIGEAIESRRGQKDRISLVDDILPAGADRDCLHSVLTAFGGRAVFDPQAQSGEVQIGRPAAGARLSIDLWLEDRPAQGITSVVIVTGDPKSPIEVLDWRQFRAAGRERCHATSES